jgi:hypothetical protein
LRCLARAFVRRAGDSGFGLDVPADDDAWSDWRPDKEPLRRAELEAAARLSAPEVRAQAAEVVRDVAAGHPELVARQAALWLEALPDRLRRALSRTDDPSGRTVPPDLPLRGPHDLLALLSREDDFLSPPTDLAAPALSPPRAAPGTLPPPRVTLTVVGGKGSGEQFVFTARTTCIIGRDKGCYPRFPKDAAHQAISRHHCLLEIDPPAARVRDLGSRTGTFVNGELIGRRPAQMSDEEGRALTFDFRELKDGDELRLSSSGAVTFTVTVYVPVACAVCGALVTQDGAPLCDECRKKGGQPVLPA